MSLGPYGSGQLLFPMRTGNNYRYVFTPDSANPSVIELHEYALFRYGTLLLCDSLDTKGECDVPTPASQCVVANEKTTIELGCADKEIISDIEFADYGEPTGTCTVCLSLSPFRFLRKYLCILSHLHTGHRWSEHFCSKQKLYNRQRSVCRARIVFAQTTMFPDGRKHAICGRMPQLPSRRGSMSLDAQTHECRCCLCTKPTAGFE